MSRSIESSCAESSFELVAFVYMPEHLHLLVYPKTREPNIGRFLARLKQPFSKEIKRILINSRSSLLDKLTVRERPGQHCFRFWQEGPGFDRNIYSPKALQASVDYIHDNPSKRGLCNRAVDWKWSSARYYLLEPPTQQFEAFPFVHGVPLGAFDKGQ